MYIIRKELGVMSVRKGKAKKIAALLSAVLLTGISVISAFAPAGVVKAENKDAAKYNAENIRSLQQGIVEWKKQIEGEAQVLAGDLLDGAGGGSSDWVAFDISRMGIRDNQAAYLSRLKDQVEKIYKNLDDSRTRYRVSDIHRLVLTIGACGGDPTNFGTDPDGKPIDLVNDSVWNSLWGDPGDQGLNGYIWALLAVDSKNYEEPEGAEWTRQRLVEALLSRQLADGGFGLVKTDPSDVDLTSMTLTALAPYANSDKTYTVTNIVTEQETTLTVDQMAEKAFACLSDLQQKDGTMITYNERTSESTSWAMLALASWGRDPDTDEQFIKGGNSLLDGIQKFRLADGGVIHSLDGDDKETVGNNMAGYQAVYGLEAVYRLKTGAPKVFDLSDASTISEEEIEKAGASLPALKEKKEENRSGEEVQADVENRGLYLTIGIAAVIVVIVGGFLFFLLRGGKKQSGSKKQGKGFAPEDDDDDDDEEEW